MKEQKLISVLMPFMAGFLLMGLWSNIVYYFALPDIPGGFLIYGALFEEGMKFGLAVLLIRKGAKPLNMALVGIGFGIAEQLSHFWYPHGSIGLVAPWMHAVGGVAMGLFLQKAYLGDGKPKKKYLWLAFLAPLAIHALYNEALRIMLYLVLH